MQSKQLSAALTCAFKCAHLNCAPILASPRGAGDQRHRLGLREEELLVISNLCKPGGLVLF